MARMLLCVALCLAVAACGTEDATPADAKAAALVAERFYDALAAVDGVTACRALAPDVAHDVAGGSTCDAAFVGPISDAPEEIREDLGRVTARPVGVDGGTVTVEVKTPGRFTQVRTQRLELKRIDGEWRITERPEGSPGGDPVAQCITGGIETFEAGKTDAIWRLVGREQFVYYIQHLCKRVVAENADDSEVAPIGREIFREMVRDGRIDETP